MECVEDIFLVVCLGPPEPGAVDQETFVFEPYGKRRCPTSVTSPIVPSVWTVRTRKLRVENVLAGLYVCPTSSCSLVDEVFDHLLMLHRFCDFPVPAIHLFRKQLRSIDNLLSPSSFVARAGRTVRQITSGAHDHASRGASEPPQDQPRAV